MIVPPVVALDDSISAATPIAPDYRRSHMVWRVFAMLDRLCRRHPVILMTCNQYAIGAIVLGCHGRVQAPSRTGVYVSAWRGGARARVSPSLPTLTSVGFFPDLPLT